MEKTVRRKIGIIFTHHPDVNGREFVNWYKNKHIGYELSFAMFLHDAGFEPIIFIPVKHIKKPLKFYHKSGIKIVACPIEISFGRHRETYFSMLREILRESPEMVYILSYYLPFYDVLSFFLWIKKIPFIAYQHGTCFMQNSFHIFRYPFLIFTLRLAKEVFFVNVYEGYYLRKFFKIRGKFVPNFVDKELFKLSKQLENKQITKDNDVLYIGRLIPIKRLDLLIKTVAQIPKIKLTIIGEGEEKEKLIKLTKKLKLEKRVKFLPFTTDKKEIAMWYKRSKVTVIPSKFEAFSLVAVESLMFGTPCIVSKNTGIAPILFNYDELLCFEGDELKEKIKKVLKTSTKEENYRKIFVTFFKAEKYIKLILNGRGRYEILCISDYTYI